MAANDRGFDVIVVGSGIAGLVAALTVAPRARVAVVTKGVLSDGCSRWAQGGIAAAVGRDDSSERHFDDTVSAGRGLSKPPAVRVLVEDGPSRIRELIEWGVAFDTQDGELLLGREAAHSEARILHAHGDGTGLEIESALIRRLRMSSAQILEDATVTALLGDGARCTGVEVCDASGASPLPNQLDGFEVPDERLNPNGGAVAIGHPFGPSGTRYVLTTPRRLMTSSRACASRRMRET